MSADTPVGYTRLLRTNTNFRNLWLGEVVSQLGDWFNFIASTTMIATLTGSGVAVGGLFAVRAVAPLLISPIAGVLADRFDRRRILLVCDISRIFVVLGFLFVRDPSHVWLLYLLTAVQLAFGGVFFTTKRAITPDIVGEAEIGTANTISSASWSVMLAFGAAAGGFVSGAFGVYTAFTIDAVTFVLGALIVSRIRYAVPDEIRQADPISLRRLHEPYLEGLRYVFQRPEMVAIAFLKPALLLTMSSGYEVVQVRIAERVFPIGVGGSTTLGLLYCMSGIGSGVGPVAARVFTQDRIPALRKAIGLGFGIAAAGLFTIAPLYSFLMMLVGGLLRSIGGGIVWVFSTQLLLLLAPTRVRGRVFSFEQAGFSLFGAISAAAGGQILDRFSDFSTVVYGFGLITLLPLVAWSLWCWLRPPIDPNQFT